MKTPFLLLLLLLSPWAQAHICDTKTSPEHWYYQALSKFVEAGGCAIQGTSLKSSYIQAPFFVISKLNTKALQTIEKPMDLSVFEPSSAARQVLEGLKSRPDVLMVLAPITDGTGLVFSQEADSSVIDEMKQQFSFLPDIEKVQIIFVLGNAAKPLTVIHENKHVQDIQEGKLPLKSAFEALVNGLDKEIVRRNNVSDKEIETLKDWLQSSLRSTPEISALQEEYRYLLKQRSIKGSFLDYLKASEHDYINKNLGVFWLNQSLRNDAKTEFLKMASGQVCGFIATSFQKLELSSFAALYPNCRISPLRKKKNTFSEIKSRPFSRRTR